jgi:arylsulfatase
MKAGRVHEVYNYGGLEWTTVSSPEKLAPGKHTIHYQYVPLEKKPGAGATSTLSVDGEKVGEQKVPRTMPFVCSADEGVDVGLDSETPVTEEYIEGENSFTGKIHRVTVALE